MDVDIGLGKLFEECGEEDLIIGFDSCEDFTHCVFMEFHDINCWFVLVYGGGVGWFGELWDVF